MSHTPTTSSSPSPEEPAEAHLTLSNEPDAIRQAEERFLQAVNAFHYPTAAVFALRLALEEAVANAFRHGHRNMPGVPIRVDWCVDRYRVQIEVEDSGPGFKPECVPDPTTPDRLEVPSGRGLMLMKAYMTSVEYNPTGNRVKMLYRREA